MQKFPSVLTFFALIILIVPNPVYAYLDPGTGSMLIQMIIGGIVAALFTIKMYWYRLKEFIKKIFGRSNQDDNVNSVDDFDKPKK